MALAECCDMKSAWLANAPPHTNDEFRQGDRFDVVVIGAGLTGMVTAELLARAGKKVAVVEGRFLGAVTTGNTTAKVSLLQGTHMSSVLQAHPMEVGRAYVAANRAGQEWLVEFCEQNGIGVERRDAYTYAASSSSTSKIDEEVSACRSVGLDVERVDTLALPFVTYGAARMADQFQINPMEPMAAMCQSFRARGGTLFEGARVTDLQVGDWVHLTTNLGPLFARKVVVATGFPALDRSAYFARLEPSRSYVIAVRTNSEKPQGMYISVDQPTRSLRTARFGDEELLLVGGNGHVVGRQESAQALFDDLEDWTSTHFGETTTVYSWSAQDYRTLDGLPAVEPALAGQEQVLVATGYDKWGMTNAPAAALALSGRILGAEPDWARILYRRGGEALGRRAARALGQNSSVFLQTVRGWGGCLVAGQETSPNEGEGVTHFDGLTPVGVSKVDGQEHRISAVCPHMGGILRWNDAEKSWDCPLHGSRFAADGRVLEGPAVRDCKRL